MLKAMMSYSGLVPPLLPLVHLVPELNRVDEAFVDCGWVTQDPREPADPGPHAVSQWRCVCVRERKNVCGCVTVFPPWISPP